MTAKCWRCGGPLGWFKREPGCHGNCSSATCKTCGTITYRHGDDGIDSATRAAEGYQP